MKLRNRGIEICLLQISGAQVGAVAGVVGAKTKRGLELWNRTGRVPRLDQRQSEIIVRIRIVGMQLHDSPKRPDRAFDFTRPLQHQTKLGLRLGEIRLQLHRGLKFLDGLVRAVPYLPARAPGSNERARFGEQF